VAITTPVPGASIASGVTTAFMATAHDAEDGDRAAHVRWSSNLAGSLGTGATVQAVLAAGTHVVTASVTDASGAVGQAQVTVTVAQPPAPPAPPPAAKVTLDASTWRLWFYRTVTLSWTSSPWNRVDVYRNGVRIATVGNDGSHVDVMLQSGTFRYKVCDTLDTQSCSNELSVRVK
jgi:hypothetical protein